MQSFLSFQLVLYMHASKQTNALGSNDAYNDSYNSNLQSLSSLLLLFFVHAIYFDQD